MSVWDHPDIRAIVELALREDIGSGDITTGTCIPASRMATGRFYARQDLVISGLELLQVGFRLHERPFDAEKRVLGSAVTRKWGLRSDALVL